jgi:hypothetical protein
MKFCHAHEDRLRVELSEKGLDHYIAKGIAVDPLLAARYAITLNALVACGASLLVTDNAGELPCPLCYLAKNVRCTDPTCTHESHQTEIDLDWVKSSVEEQRRRYAETK